MYKPELLTDGNWSDLSLQLWEQLKPDFFQNSAQFLAAAIYRMIKSGKNGL